MIKLVGAVLLQSLLIACATANEPKIIRSSPTAAAVGVTISNVRRSALFLLPSVNCVYDFDVRYEPKSELPPGSASIEATISLWDQSEETLLFSEVVTDSVAFTRRLRVTDSSDYRLVFLVRTDYLEQLVDLDAIVKSEAITVEEDASICNEDNSY